MCKPEYPSNVRPEKYPRMPKFRVRRFFIVCEGFKTEPIALCKNIGSKNETLCGRTFILFLILVSTVMLMVQTPLWPDPNSTTFMHFKIIDYVLSSFFILEAVFKIFAFGPPRAETPRSFMILLQANDHCVV